MNPLGDERGETLVELLITVLVIAIGLVAVVGAIGGSILVSDAHRSMAVSEVLVRDFGEAIKEAAADNVDDPDTVADEYEECPDESVLAPSAFVVPEGWADPVITSIEYWIQSDDPDVYPNGDFGGTQDDCLTEYANCGDDIPACDPGLQRVSYSISNDRDADPDDYGGTTASGSVVVRRGNPEETP